MADGSPRPTVVFVHVPKTAGTTLKGVLAAQYRRVHDVPGRSAVESIERFRQLDPEERSAVDLVMGHLTLGLHDALPRGCDYLTFLRNPVEQVMSGFHQIRRNPRNPLHNALLVEADSPEAYIDFQRKWGIDNLQTRHLAGVAPHVRPEADAVDFDLEGDRYREIARQNIETHIRLTFLTEMFDEALIILKHTLGWRRKPFYQRQNVGEADRAPTRLLPRDLVSRIERANRHDVELYEFAKAHYAKLRETHAQVLQRELGEFRRQNQRRRFAGQIGSIRRRVARLTGHHTR